MSKTPDRHFYNSDDFFDPGKDTEAWLLENAKQTGDYVFAGEAVCELEFVKATLLLEAKTGGIVKLHLNEGDKVESQTCVFEVENVGDEELLHQRLIEFLAKLAEPHFAEFRPQSFQQVAPKCSIRLLLESIPELVDCSLAPWLQNFLDHPAEPDWNALKTDMSFANATEEFTFRAADLLEDDCLDLLRWSARDGEIVHQGDSVCELEATKAIISIPTPATGRLSISADRATPSLEAPPLQEGEKLFEVQPLSLAEIYGELLKTKSLHPTLLRRFGQEAAQTLFRKIKDFGFVHIEQLMPKVINSPLDEIVLEAATIRKYLPEPE